MYVCSLKKYVAGVPLLARCILSVESPWRALVTVLLHPHGALKLSPWVFGGRGECENDLYLFRRGPLTEVVSDASH